MAEQRFLDSHEWHQLDGNLVTLGLSRFAVDELTDVTFVELPEVGDELTAGESIGEIESVKATSELYTGVSGTVVEVNDKVVEDPSLINEDPQGDGWLLRIEAGNPSELDKLMSREDYDQKYPAEG
jgi:glycine cleavage system H protein